MTLIMLYFFTAGQTDQAVQPMVFKWAQQFGQSGTDEKKASYS